MERLSFIKSGMAVSYRLDGSRQKPCVALSNSLASRTSIWDDLVKALLQDFHVLRYDLRGHGDSASVPGDYTVAELASDLAALLVHLGIRSFHMVGLSLGGMIALELAAQAQFHILSMVLCAVTGLVPAGVWEPRLHQLKTEGLRPLVQSTLDRWFSPEFAKSNPTLVERIRAVIGSTSVEGYAGCAAAVRDFDFIGRLPDISVPTLVVASDADASVPVSAAELLQDRIPDAELIVLRGAGHMLVLERPRQVSGAIVEFLRRHQAAATTERPDPRGIRQS